MREREIRYSMGTSITTRVLPVAEGVSDKDAADLARNLGGRGPRAACCEDCAHSQSWHAGVVTGSSDPP